MNRRVWGWISLAWIGTAGLCGCEKPVDRAPGNGVIRETQTTDIRTRQVASRGGKSEGLQRIRQRSRVTTATGLMAMPPRRLNATGQVLLPDGSPAVGAIVTLWTKDDSEITTMSWRRVTSVQTNERGKYQLKGERKDQWGITIRKAGYAAVARADHRQLVHRGPGTIDFGLQTELEPEVVVRGRVEGGDTGRGTHVLLKPDQASDLLLYELNSYTNERGEFEISGVPGGKGSVFAHAPERAISQRTYESAEFVTVPPLKRGISVSGKLNSSDADFTDNDITVIVSAGQNSREPRLISTSRVDAEGRFMIRNARYFRSYHFELRSRRFLLVNPKEYENPGDENQDLNEVNLDVRPLQMVTGRVFEKGTSVPIAGARFYLNSKTYETDQPDFVTTGSGEYSLNEADWWSIAKVESDSHHWSSDQRYRRIRSPDMELEKSYFIRGQVKSPSGIIPLNTTVTGFPDELYDKAGQVARVEPDGSFKVRIYGHKLCVAAQAPGYPPVFSEMIKNNQRDEEGIVLMLGEGKLVSGNVVNRSGDGVAGARVSIHAVSSYVAANQLSYNPYRQYHPGRLLGETVTNDKGQFEMKNVSGSVPLKLLAEHKDYVYPATEDFIPLSRDERSLRMLLEDCTSKTLYVTDERDRPVTGAQVMVSILRREKEKTEYVSYEGTDQFVLDRLPRDTTLTLQVKKDGYFEQSRTLNLDNNIERVRLQSRELVDITVRCLDAETNEPVDVTVHGEYSNQSGTQLNVGEFQFKGLEPNGQFVFSVVPRKTAMGSLKGEAQRLFSDGKDSGYQVQTLEITPKPGDSQTYTILMRKPGYVTGRVIDRTGNPVAGAEIRNLYGTGQSVPKTGADGRFRFKVEYGRTFFVKTDDNRKSDNIYVPSTSAPLLDLGDISIFDRGAVRVRVLDGNEKGVRGAKVGIAVKRSEGQTIDDNGITDGAGEVVFKAGYGHDLVVSLLKPDADFSRITEESLVTLKHLTGTNTESGERLVILHNVAGGVSGNLFYKDKPVAGKILIKSLADLKIQKRATAGDDGKYSFANLPPGRYHLLAEGEDSRGQIEESVEISIKGDETINQDIILKAKDKALGVFLTDEKGESVPDAVITVRDEDGKQIATTPSNSSGYGGIWMPGTGKFMVSASHAKHGVSETKAVTIRENEGLNRVYLQLAAAEGTVQCSALSYLDGLPVRKATGILQLNGSSTMLEGTRGSAEGDVLFRHVRPGNYTLTVRAYGYQAVKRAVTVSEGDALQLDEVLMPAGMANISCRDAGGNYLQGAQVELQPGNHKTISSENGDAVFENLEPGNYAGTVKSRAGSTSHFQIQVMLYHCARAEVVVP